MWLVWTRQKSDKIFLNLGKQKGSQDTIKNLLLVINTHILECSRKFYENLLLKKGTKKRDRKRKIFNWCWHSKTLWKSSKTLWGKFNRIRFIKFFEKDAKDKSPGNDGLTKYFYGTFWNELKDIFVDSVSETKEKGNARKKQCRYF